MRYRRHTIMLVGVVILLACSVAGCRRSALSLFGLGDGRYSASHITLGPDFSVAQSATCELECDRLTVAGKVVDVWGSLRVVGGPSGAVMSFRNDFDGFAVVGSNASLELKQVTVTGQHVESLVNACESIIRLYACEFRGGLIKTVVESENADVSLTNCIFSGQISVGSIVRLQGNAKHLSNREGSLSSSYINLSKCRTEGLAEIGVVLSRRARIVEDGQLDNQVVYVILSKCRLKLIGIQEGEGINMSLLVTNCALSVQYFHFARGSLFVVDSEVTFMMLDLHAEIATLLRTRLINEAVLPMRASPRQEAIVIRKPRAITMIDCAIVASFDGLGMLMSYGRRVEMWRCIVINNCVLNDEEPEIIVVDGSGGFVVSDSVFVGAFQWNKVAIQRQLMVYNANKEGWSRAKIRSDKVERIDGILPMAPVELAEEVAFIDEIIKMGCVGPLGGLTKVLSRRVKRVTKD